MYSHRLRPLLSPNRARVTSSPILPASNGYRLPSSPSASFRLQLLLVFLALALCIPAACSPTLVPQSLVLSRYSSFLAQHLSPLLSITCSRLQPHLRIRNSLSPCIPQLVLLLCHKTSRKRLSSIYPPSHAIPRLYLPASLRRHLPTRTPSRSLRQTRPLAQAPLRRQRRDPLCPLQRLSSARG